MSPVAQFLHVLVRDLRRGWLLWGSYVTTIAVGAAVTVDWLPSPMRDMGGLVLLLLVLGSVLALVTTLAHSTVRVDAWWAMLPLRPSAIVAAKGAQLALLVALPLGAAAAILAGAAYGPRMIVATVLLSGGALAAWYGALAIVASACRDLREGIAASLAIVLMAFVVTVATLGAPLALPWPRIAMVQWGTAAVCGALLAWRLARRGPRLGVRLATAGAGVVAALVGAQANRPPREVEPPAAPTPLRDVRLLLDPDRPVRCSDGLLEIGVRADPGAARSLVVGGARLELTTRSGERWSAEAWDTGRYGVAELADGPVAPPFTRGDTASTLLFRSTAITRARCAETVSARLHYFGRSSAGEVIARLPWRDGARFDRPGTSLRLHVPVPGQLDLSTVTVGEVRSRLDDGPQGVLDHVFLFDDPAHGARTRFVGFPESSTRSDLPGVSRERFVHALSVNDAVTFAAVRAPSPRAALLVVAVREVAAGAAVTPAIRFSARSY